MRKIRWEDLPKGEGQIIRYALLFIVIFILVLIPVSVMIYGSVKQNNYQQDSLQATADYKVYAYDPALKACPSSRSDCVIEARKAYQANARSDRELEAQRITASWTAIMGVSTIVGMLLSAVGIGLVWKTFEATRHANEIAQDEFVAANSPRILATQIDIDVGGWEKTGKPGYAKIYVYNGGGNDASVCNTEEGGYGSIIFHAGVHPPAARPFLEKEGHGRANPLILSNGKLAAGAGHWWQLDEFEVVSPADVRRAVSRWSKVKLFVIGRIHYMDTRGAQHLTIFCREFDKAKRRWILTDYPEYENQRI